MYARRASFAYSWIKSTTQWRHVLLRSQMSVRHIKCKLNLCMFERYSRHAISFQTIIYADLNVDTKTWEAGCGGGGGGWGGWGWRRDNRRTSRLYLKIPIKVSLCARMRARVCVCVCVYGFIYVSVSICLWLCASVWKSLKKEHCHFF